MAATITRDIFMAGASDGGQEINCTEMLLSLVEWVKQPGAFQTRFVYLYLTAASAWGGVNYAEGRLELQREKTKEYTGHTFSGKVKVYKNHAPWDALDELLPPSCPFTAGAPTDLSVKVRVGTGEIFFDSEFSGRISNPDCGNNLLFGFLDKNPNQSPALLYITQRHVVLCLSAKSEFNPPQPPF